MAGIVAAAVTHGVLATAQNRLTAASQVKSEGNKTRLSNKLGAWF
jgi:hypothetical protein